MAQFDLRVIEHAHKLRNRKKAMDLLDLGYGPDFQQSFLSLGRSELLPARVVREDRGRLWVDHGEGPRAAEARGALRKADPTERPAVGDWVAAEPREGLMSVHCVLPRRSAFIRGRAGRRNDAQCIAANIDTLFIAMGLDGDYNPRRLERYLVLAQRGGSQPVVLLTKADRSDDPVRARQQTLPVAGDVPVLAVCALEDRGLDALSEFMVRGQTIAIVGSSGVGKSTLVNRLVGNELMDTGAVREGDDKGRHTTRHRQLIELPSGACIIDTPGMRELQMWGDEHDVGAGFADIEELAAACRFRNCEHEEEPGCAVTEAVDDGSLDPDRLANFITLRTELRHTTQRRSQTGGHERRREGRRFAKMAAQAQRLKRR